MTLLVVIFYTLILVWLVVGFGARRNKTRLVSKEEERWANQALVQQSIKQAEKNITLRKTIEKEHDADHHAAHNVKPQEEREAEKDAARIKVKEQEPEKESSRIKAEEEAKEKQAARIKAEEEAARIKAEKEKNKSLILEYDNSAKKIHDEFESIASSWADEFIDYIHLLENTPLEDIQELLQIKINHFEELHELSEELGQQFLSDLPAPKKNTLADDFKIVLNNAHARVLRQYNSSIEKILRQVIARPPQKISDSFQEVYAFGEQARVEFLDLVRVLGDRFDDESVLENFRKKYGPDDAVEEAKKRKARKEATRIKAEREAEKETAKIKAEEVAKKRNAEKEAAKIKEEQEAEKQVIPPPRLTGRKHERIRQLLHWRMKLSGFVEPRFQSEIEKMGRRELMSMPENTLITNLETVWKRQGKGDFLVNILNDIENHRKQIGHDPQRFAQILEVANHPGIESGHAVPLYCMYRTDLEHRGVVDPEIFEDWIRPAMESLFE